MVTTTSDPSANTVQRQVTSLRQLLTARVRLKLVAVVALFVGLGGLGYWWGTGHDALARLVQVHGTTERDESGATAKWYAAKAGDAFYGGDGARTASGARAHFELAGGAKLKLEEDSLVRFHRRKPDAPIKVDVEMGAVDVQSGASAITIDSEFGALVLDADSAVTLSRRGSVLRVDVEFGGVQMNQRELSAGKPLSFELGGIVVDVATPPPPDVAEQVTAASPDVEPKPPATDLGDGVSYADLVTSAGASIVVHDPNPPTAVGISSSGVCDGPARLQSGAQQTEGVGQLSLAFTAGQHTYQVVCLDAPQRVVAKGRISIVRDSGTQRLPTFAPTANVVTDGRVYTVMYQHKLPNVSVSWPTAPQADSYTLSIGGRTITTKTPHYTLRALNSGRHSVTFAAATTPARASRQTVVEVSHDTQAPTGEVVYPPVGFAPSDSVAVRGNALPGWSVSIAGKEVTVDSQRTFSTQAEGNQTIPIVFSHPTHGTHYYLRRPKAAR